jgi:hypothetical protein
MSWVIDRFEGKSAVLENTETLEIVTHLRSGLPANIREGDVLTLENGVYTINKAETNVRAKRIRRRFNRLTGGG